MPFALVTAGLLMIVVGAKGTYAAFGSQLTADLTGGFFYWIAAIGAVGALGYIDTLRTFSHLFLALIIIAIFLNNGGFFAQLQSAVQKGPAAIPATEVGSNPFGTTDLFGNNTNAQGAPTLGGQTFPQMLNGLFGGSK